MKPYRCAWKVLSCSLILSALSGGVAGCGSQESSTPAVSKTERKIRAGEVLTAGDMEQLQTERAALINRPSPLHEEEDVVDQVKRQAAR
jgi:hypothetical protein